MTFHVAYLIPTPPPDELTLVGTDVRALQQRGLKVTLFDATRLRIEDDLRTAGATHLFGDAAAIGIATDLAARTGLPLLISLNPRATAALAADPKHLLEVLAAARTVVVATEYDRQVLVGALPPQQGARESQIVYLPIAVSLPPADAAVKVGDRANLLGLGGFIGHDARVLELQCLDVLVKRGEDARLDILAPADEWTAVRELAERVGLSDRVTLHSRPAELLARIGERRVVVAAASSDGIAPALSFLRPVVQAMAAGTPLVAVGSPWMQELVMHGAEGYVAPRNHADAEALAPAIRSLLRDAVLWERFSASGRRRVSQRFGADARAKAFEELLRAGED